MAKIHRKTSYIGRDGKSHRSEERACILCNKIFYAIKDFGIRKQKYCGKICWNKRATIFNNCKYCNKEIKTYKSINKVYCGNDCRNVGYKGRKLDAEHIKKISDSLKGKIPKHHFKKGEKHPFWIKDRSLINFCKSPEWITKRIEILKRDNYSCRKCGIRGKKGIRPKLSVHHIKSRKLYPELALENNNLMIMCFDCHKLTDSFLNRWQFTSKKAIKI